MARTPGPYKATLSLADLNATITGKGRQHVATVWSGNKPNVDTVIANATLFANADRMREALAMCYGALTEEGATPRQRAVAIRAARRVLDRTPG